MIVLIIKSLKVGFIASANKIRKHSRVELVLLSPAYTALVGEHHTRGVQESSAVYIHIPGTPHHLSTNTTHPYPLTPPLIVPTLQNLTNYTALYGKGFI